MLCRCFFRSIRDCRNESGFRRSELVGMEHSGLVLRSCTRNEIYGFARRARCSDVCSSTTPQRPQLERTCTVTEKEKIFLAGGIAFLIGSPYYIRNWLVLGCPIYPPPPGYAAWCSPKYLTPDSISQFHAYIRQRGIGLGRGFSAFLRLPFNITFYTSNFHGAGGIGLCPLALGPIGLLSFRNDRAIKFLAVLSVVLISAWFATQQESRFLIHVYVFSAVFAVLGWHSVRGMASKLSKYLTIAVVLISFSYGYFMIAKENLGAIRSVFSSRYAMLRHESMPYCASFEYLNNHDSVRKVLVLDQSVPALYSDKSYVKPVGQWGERTLPRRAGHFRSAQVCPCTSPGRIPCAGREIGAIRISNSFGHEGPDASVRD